MSKLFYWAKVEWQKGSTKCGKTILRLKGSGRVAAAITRVPGSNPI